MCTSCSYENTSDATDLPNGHETVHQSLRAQTEPTQPELTTHGCDPQTLHSGINKQSQQENT